MYTTSLLEVDRNLADIAGKFVVLAPGYKVLNLPVLHLVII